MATDVPQTRASQAELPSLNLKELNKTSCRVGQWTVRVVRPEIQRYDYLVNGKTVQGQKLQCLLVSEDAEIYKCNVSIIVMALVPTPTPDDRAQNRSSLPLPLWTLVLTNELVWFRDSNV